jgi:hypothetical protein
VLSQCKLKKVAARVTTELLEFGGLLNVPYDDMKFIEQSIGGACNHKILRKNYEMQCVWYKRLPEDEKKNTIGKDKLQEVLKEINNQSAIDELNEVEELETVADGEKFDSDVNCNSVIVHEKSKQCPCLCSIL